jgi:hypothetical protein
MFLLLEILVLLMTEGSSVDNAFVGAVDVLGRWIAAAMEAFVLRNAHLGEKSCGA